MRESPPGPPAIDVGPVLEFLGSSSPAAWIEAALGSLESLLLDHAALELKAAQQAQKLIRKYGGAASRAGLSDEFRSRLTHRLSRLAREELRHFEQVVALIERRGGSFVAISSSRYAAGLHALARSAEPGALIDALIIGAVIEARSCERFYRLQRPLESVDPGLAAFYRSLLRSEARHFEDYLALARAAAGAGIDGRVREFLERDTALMASADTELRFHSGIPGAPTRPRSLSRDAPRP
jgi:tRNA-(ms[2]io[6]A)-hydroxylase